MPSGAQNKHKARRSSRKAGYYDKQYFRTTANKVRRKKRMERRKVQFAKPFTGQPKIVVGLRTDEPQVV